MYMYMDMYMYLCTYTSQDPNGFSLTKARAFLYLADLIYFGGNVWKSKKPVDLLKLRGMSMYMNADGLGFTGFGFMRYVCMYACMYVCVCACMYVWMYVCMYMCMYVCMYYLCDQHHVFFSQIKSPSERKSAWVGG